MNLPIVKQLLGTMNWVMDKIFDQICAVIPLKEIFAYIADKLNPVSDETLEQIRTCIQGWKELSFEKLQPITNAFSRCIPRQPKLIGLSEYLGVELSGDHHVQIPVGAFGFMEDSDMFSCDGVAANTASPELDSAAAAAAAAPSAYASPDTGD